jgi:serine/threonine-protein kinase
MVVERRLGPRSYGTAWASTVLVGSITGIALTADWLPARVASHFGPGGLANGFMAREVYLAFTIGMVVLPPALAGLGIVLALRYFPQFLNLPNRDYWLAPERRDATADFLMAHAAWLAALLSLLALGVHLLLIRANRAVPPRLDAGPFLAMLLAFLVAMAAWVGVLARRFRRP